MKGCSIYKTKKAYKIVTMFRRESWAYLLSKPIFILPLETNIEELSEKIFGSLTSSRSISEDEEDNFDINLLKEIKEKSYNQLYKNSASCDIFLKESIIEIIPLKYAGKNQGLDEIADQIKEISYSKEKELEITSLIINKLDELGRG